MLMKASEAKVAALKAKPTLSELLQARITIAANKGFNSTRFWLKNPDQIEATQILTQAGYSISVREQEEFFVHLEVSWD